MATLHRYEQFDDLDTLPAVIAARAVTDRDRTFVQDVTAGTQLTFGELHDAALVRAGALRRLGVEPGDRVAVMVPSGIDAALAWLGIAWAGALEVPLNPAFLGEMLHYLLSNSGATTAIVASELVERLAAVLPRLESLTTVVVADSDAAPDLGPVRVVGRDEWLRDAVAPAEPPVPMPWDVASILYTSGTTGPSKGVLVPWGQFLHSVSGLDDLGPDDAYYSPLPLFHTSGKSAFSQMAYCGGRLVVRDRFDTGSFWRDVDAYGCTFTLMVPAIATWLLAQEPAPDDRAHALQQVNMAPIVPEFGERFGVRLRTGYGLTEAGSVLRRLDVTDHSPSSGTPMPGYTVRLVDDHDYEVAPGEVGELVVRTDQPWGLCVGYHAMPEQTAAAWRNGWLHTGDGFRRDDNGEFFFVDRIKDAIRRRGENVSSFEVEAIVSQHPGVAACAAIGVAAGPGEQEIKVCVVKEPDATLTEAELIEFLVPRMPRFMVPRYVEFYDDFPRTGPTLRVQKSRLREAPITARTWDRESG